MVKSLLEQSGSQQLLIILIKQISFFFSSVLALCIQSIAGEKKCAELLNGTKQGKYTLFLSFCGQHQLGKQLLLGACKHYQRMENLSPPGAFVTKPLRISPKGLPMLFSKPNGKRSIPYKNTVSHSIIIPE